LFFLRSLFLSFKNTFSVLQKFLFSVKSNIFGFSERSHPQVNFSFKRPAEGRQIDPTVCWPASASSNGLFKSLCESQNTWLFRSPAAVRLQKPPAEDCVGRIAGFRSLLLAFIQAAGCKPASASSRKTGGFTMLETLIGLALVSATGFVVTFMSANMMTSTQRKHDTYRCSSIAGNVLAHFSKNGSRVLSNKVATISTTPQNSGGGATKI